jgi:Family of unknown function (DUF6134)
MRRALFVWAAVAAVAPVQAADTVPAPAGQWTFRALLDGSPIGEHRFSVTATGDERRVVSEAAFDVKFLGITAYRYRHKATEQWRGDCLTALDSTTDDDGKPSRVQARREGEAFNVTGGTESAAHPGCVMSFAYWNPAIASQSQLFNAQNGKLEKVRVQRVGTGSVEVRGKPVNATEYRINRAAETISVWYSLQGDWLGLDSTVAGGRKLSYRLQ